jgi:two-component system sensor histidine kinase AgrC
MSVIFFHQRNKRQQTYQDRFSTEQIKNLKMYTDQLEADQLKLRHFKHDYKNLLFSLKTVVQTKDTQKINEAINKLENYSDEYLNGLSMDLYQDLKNVQNPYLKSLFIGKLNLINQHQIACHFHCSQQLSEVPMNIYDLIGLLDTAIDNAIFFSRKQDPGEIYLSVTQEGHQLAFLIYNSITKNSSTEENGHLEALNIKELKQKYSNLFIQYNQNSKWFRFHVTLITKGD